MSEDHKKAGHDLAAESKRLDMELDQTFPASDAIPSWTHEVAPAELYLEDLAVGQKFTTRPVTITASEIKTFAAQFDPQPFHLDAELAEKSVFGGLVASGWHTAALTMRLLVDSGPQIAGGLIGLGGHIEWPRATRAGDTLYVESEVVEITPSRTKPDRGVVTIRHRTLNQQGQPVQNATMKLRVPRDPPGGS